MPIHSTQIVRMDGLMLAASVETQNAEKEIDNVKNQQRQIMNRMTNSTEPRAAIDVGQYKLHYYRHEDIVFFAITERAFPKELAAMYLTDISSEFLNTHKDVEYRSSNLRPYAYNQFDTFIQRTKKSYENPRASDNLDRVQVQLKETTHIMSKNIEDLLARGDSLERMSTMSSDLKDASRKYKRAAVRINWELLLKQYGPVGALGLIILVFIVWRFS